MKVFVYLAFICTIVTVTNAAVAVIPADPNPNHPGHCNSQETGPMAKNEEKTIQDCVGATCNNDRSISLASCVSVGGQCRLTIDKTKKYPACCVIKCT